MGVDVRGRGDPALSGACGSGDARAERARTSGAAAAMARAHKRSPLHQERPLLLPFHHFTQHNHFYSPEPVLSLACNAPHPRRRERERKGGHNRPLGSSSRARGARIPPRPAPFGPWPRSGARAGVVRALRRRASSRSTTLESARRCVFFATHGRRARAARVAAHTPAPPPSRPPPTTSPSSRSSTPTGRACRSGTRTRTGARSSRSATCGAGWRGQA